MGYLIPGTRFKRYGDSLIPNNSSDGTEIPSVSPVISNTLSSIGGRSAVARSKTVTASADISRTAPTFNDPRYSFTTLSIPTDLRTLNGLYRFFDDTDPIVGNALKLHCEFPLSRISLKDHGDPVIQAHYEEMWNRIKVDKLLFDVALEYWRIGNCHLPESPVLTKAGYKRIDEVKVGDRVLTSKDTFEKVTHILPREADENIYKIIPWKINTFKGCTGDHPILTDVGWVLAKDLKKGDLVRLALPPKNPHDKIQKIEDYWYAEIKEIKVTQYKGTVYDLTVENVHDFECGGLITHNCFPYGAWNVSDHMWDQFVILNPDYVTVEGTYLNKRPFIKLQPDEHLKKVVTTGQPKFLYDQLPKEIIKYVRMGQEIPLSPQNVFHVAHNKAPYETLGRSIIKRILKSLIYEDRMSMANFAIATRQTIPITVVKVGDATSGWIPSDAELDEVREMLASREVDPNFCYDSQTECLTDEGWLTYDKITFKHKVASFNKDTNSIEYCHPQAINIQDRDDEMIHFKSHKVDCKVTPNHRMWVKRDGKWQVILAEDIVETDSVIDCTVEDSFPYELDIKGTLALDNIERVPYKEKIWCVTVPSGIIVTRRGGYPLVSGNSLIYHWGIDIQFYGASGKIWNLTNEFNRIMKWKLIGLGISESILTGAGSYASAYAQLEVLRQRYLHFQNTLQNFVYQGIFEPVAKQCGFYKTEEVVAGKYYQGKKYGSSDSEYAKLSEVLQKHASDYNNEDSHSYINHLHQKQASEEAFMSLEYPGLDWDLLSLSNDVQYRNFLMNFDRLFPGQRKVSDSTFYAAAKLDMATEKAKIASEHERNLEEMLAQGKVSKKYEEKFAKEGIPFPGAKPGAPQPGAPGAGAPGAGIPGMSGAPGSTPGPGGMSIPPGGVPPVGGTGGGNLMGVPGQTPNAPVGQNQFNGTNPNTPGVPRSPEASRLKSMQLHDNLTRAVKSIVKENDTEILRLRKFNKSAGIDIDKIDNEVKDNAKSTKDSP